MDAQLGLGTDYSDSVKVILYEHNLPQSQSGGKKLSDSQTGLGSGCRSGELKKYKLVV